MTKRAICIALMMAAVGCGDADPTSGVAELACSRFRTAARDAPTLTTAELRERFQDVHRLARASDSPTLASAGEDALIGITQGDVDLYGDGVERFNEECQRLGQ